MLGLGEYLLGVLEIVILVGFAWLGAAGIRHAVLGSVDGAPAHLATAVIALAILLWAGELLGAFGLFESAPYVLLVAAIGLGSWALTRGWRGGWGGRGRTVDRPQRPPFPRDRTRGQSVGALTVIALVLAAVAVVRFALETKPHLSTGMTGFDSTWYHGPFAAGFFQSGDTWDLHFIAPQFLAWFYPANSEVFHGAGMLAFDRDLLSPLLNLGWFIGCLVACWCIGRPYGVAPYSLVLGAVALSLPALSDQAGEARNDIVGIFFLLAAVAIALAQRERSSHLPASGAAFALGPAAFVGLSAGLAAGTKLNFLLPAAVLVGGIALIAPGGRRWRALAAAALAALAGGGYWYLRNLAHAGNPLPWIDDLGPVSLPAPDQALGGREGHSVLGYLTDGAVWSDWFLPGLHDGLTMLWPLLLLAAFAGLVLCLGRPADPTLRVAGLVGLAAALAWLLAPTSASGPDGMPRGFESGLRYLAPALVLGLALLPVTPSLRQRFARLSDSAHLFHVRDGKRALHRGWQVGIGVTGIVLIAIVGYSVQRHYLGSRYADPSFTAPGLNAAFAWAQGIEGARIATTSTRQYPLFGRDLSNQVEFVGDEQPHGGFTAPTTCRRWRQLLNEGDYDYVVASKDRIEPDRPPYPPTTHWTKAPNAAVVLRTPPTVIYKLTGKLAPSGCRR